MSFGINKWTPDSLATWLATFQANVQAACGVTTEVVDQAYVLARLVLEFSKLLSDMDRGLSEALSTLLDPHVATGVALDICAWRSGLKRLVPAKSRERGFAYGVPGTVLNGELLRHVATGVVWQLGPIEIGPTGVGAGEITATVFGPIVPPVGVDGAVTAWERVSTTEGWTGWSGDIALALGRLLEIDGELRARLFGYLARGGGTEGAVWVACASVSGVGAANVQVYPNRSNEIWDGIPPHYIEAVFSPGVGIPAEIAQALLEQSSHGAGFHGNTSGVATHKQLSVAVVIPYSYAVDLRGFADVTVTTTGAIVVSPADFNLTIAKLVEAWADPANGFLKTGVNPTSSALCEYLSAHVPPGTTVDIDAEFSLDGVTWAVWIAVTKRQRFRLSNQPSTAQILATNGGPYVITNGWQLVLRVTGGGDQAVVFDGTETTIELVVARLVSFGLVGIVGSASVVSTLFLQSVATGSGVLLEIRPASSAGLLAQLGLVVGNANGRDTDIDVTIV